MTWNEITQRAHAPYSGRMEACIVVGKSGMAYPGVRIENSSFPLSIHAEQAALGFCLSSGDVPNALIYQKRNEESYFWEKELSVPIIETNDIHAMQFASGTEIFDNDDVYLNLQVLSSRAQCQYSNFRVAALLETESGYVPGVNIEFSDWQRGLCAERVAISRAISSGVIIGSKINIYANKGDFISPCGGCRQVMIEHLPQGVVSLHHPNNSLSTYRTKDLLPYAFTSLTQ